MPRASIHNYVHNHCGYNLKYSSDHQLVSTVNDCLKHNYTMKYKNARKKKNKRTFATLNVTKKNKKVKSIYAFPSFFFLLYM